MDFVSHLQHVNQLFKRDDRIDVEHISLYNTLFNWWYHHRAGDTVSVCHKKMMRESGIRSSVIYEQTLRELQEYGFIRLLEKDGSCNVKMVFREDFITDEKVYVRKFRLPGIEDLKEEPKENKDSVIRKLVDEIMDRVLMIQVHLSK